MTQFLPEIQTADPVWFLAIGSLAAIVFGMGKVGFGGGVAILAVPLMIVACNDAKLAVGLMLPLLIAADYIGVVSWWRQWEMRSFILLLPGIIVGISAGGICLYYFDTIDQGEALLKLSVGIIAGGFVILSLVKKIKGDNLAFRPVAWQGVLAGTLVGVSSTLAHAAGPVATMYLINQKLGKEKFVATTVILFWIVNQIKLVPYGILGMIDTGSLLLGLWLVPAVIVGAVGGKLLNRKLGEKKFTGIIYLLLAAAAVHLVWKAGIELWGS